MKYYYLLMSQKDMLENQVVEEVVRERANYYLTRNRDLDFWILPSPKFIDDLNLNEKIKSTNFYTQKFQKNSVPYYSAFVSNDKDFIKWIELRIGYFEEINNNIKNKNYVSDGIKGEFIYSLNINILEYSKNKIDPDILSKKYRTILQNI